MEVAFDPLYVYITAIQSFDKLFDLSKKNQGTSFIFVLTFIFFIYILTLAFSAIVIVIYRHLSDGEVVLVSITRLFPDIRLTMETEGSGRQEKAIEGNTRQCKAKEGNRREQGRKDGFAFRRCN